MFDFCSFYFKIESCSDLLEYAPDGFEPLPGTSESPVLLTADIRTSLSSFVIVSSTESILDQDLLDLLDGQDKDVTTSDASAVFYISDYTQRFYELVLDLTGVETVRISTDMNSFMQTELLTTVSIDTRLA